MADIPVLVCTAGGHAGRRITIPEGGLNIGRSPDNELVLLEDGVSRFHARLHFDNGAVWLRDAGSRNGVFVNGKRVTDHKALKVGDEITLAEHTFLVKLESDSQLPSPTPPPTGEGGGGGDDTTQDEEPPKARPWYWPFSS